MSTGSRDTIIAIVDTGVDENQPDLRGRVLRGWDFHNNDARPRDDNGHGTAVAGVAAAAGNDRVGIAGMCWRCRIMPVKVLNSNGSGSHSNIAAGIIWAADHGADVINMSLAARDAHRRHVRRGRIRPTQGRGRRRRRRQRRQQAQVLPGGATRRDQRRGVERLRRPVQLVEQGHLDQALGAGLRLHDQARPLWSWWCGTSFAAPAVAGTVALMHGMRPGVSRTRLESTILGTTAGVRRVTRGRLDAARALRSIQGCDYAVA